jgi:methylmalonyl-CoA mutase
MVYEGESMSTVLSLAAEFPAVDEAEWQARVERVLKGASTSRLVSRTLDDIDIQPLYAPAHDRTPIRRDKRAEHAPAWHVVQRADIPDPARANAQILEDLNGGASAISLVLPEAVTAGRHGLAATTADDFRRVLDNVELDLIQVRLDAGRHGVWAVGLLLEVYSGRNLNAAACDLRFAADPIGRFALGGTMPAAETTAERMKRMLDAVTGAGFTGPTFAADTRVFDMAGAAPAQELGIAMASAIDYVRALDTQGCDPETAMNSIQLLLTSNADLFQSIAKLRAARLLWARLREAMELPTRDAILDVETSLRMMTTRDPHVNMLRAGAAILAAGIAGADSVTALPMTQAMGLPDAFARRMARNSQIILQEESGIGFTADAAAGSGYIETLTDELAHGGWQVFQDIEAQGGMIAALKSGHVDTLLAGTRAACAALIGKRKLGLTGVTEFPNPKEPGLDLLDIPLPADWAPPVAAGVQEEALSHGPLQQQRDSEVYEHLRERADDHVAAKGSAATIFMATLGPQAEFTARATWARNLFAVGGIELTAADTFASGDAMLEAFKAAGADVACICSSDDVYSQAAAEAVVRLKAAGAKFVYLAGEPAGLRDELASAGVDEFLKAGMDVRSTLQGAQGLLGMVEA